MCLVRGTCVVGPGVVMASLTDRWPWQGTYARECDAERCGMARRVHRLGQGNPVRAAALAAHQRNRAGPSRSTAPQVWEGDNDAADAPAFIKGACTTPHTPSHTPHDLTCVLPRRSDDPPSGGRWPPGPPWSHRWAEGPKTKVGRSRRRRSRRVQPGPPAHGRPSPARRGLAIASGGRLEVAVLGSRWPYWARRRAWCSEGAARLTPPFPAARPRAGLASRAAGTARPTARRTPPPSQRRQPAQQVGSFRRPRQWCSDRRHQPVDSSFWPRSVRLSRLGAARAKQPCPPPPLRRHAHLGRDRRRRDKGHIRPARGAEASVPRFRTD